MPFSVSSLNGSECKNFLLFLEPFSFLSGWTDRTPDKLTRAFWHFQLNLSEQISTVSCPRHESTSSWLGFLPCSQPLFTTTFCVFYKMSEFCETKSFCISVSCKDKEIYNFPSFWPGVCALMSVVRAMLVCVRNLFACFLQITRSPTWLLLEGLDHNQTTKKRRVRENNISRPAVKATLQTDRRNLQFQTLWIICGSEIFHSGAVAMQARIQEIWSGAQLYENYEFGFGGDSLSIFAAFWPLLTLFCEKCMLWSLGTVFWGKIKTEKCSIWNALPKQTDSWVMNIPIQKKRTAHIPWIFHETTDTIPKTHAFPNCSSILGPPAPPLH